MHNFSGENLLSTFQRSNLRSSRDWIGNHWVDIKSKPDIVSLVSAAVSPSLKLSTCSTTTNGANVCGSAISRPEVPSSFKLDKVEEDMRELDGPAGSNKLSDNMEWVNFEKRPLIEDKGEGVDDPVADGHKGHDKDESAGLNDDRHEDKDGNKQDMIVDIGTAI